MTHTIRDVMLHNGDEIEVEAKGAPAQIDYLQFNRQPAAAGKEKSF